MMDEVIALRPINESDTQAIVRWRNSDAVKENLFDRAATTEAQHHNWLKQKVETGLCHQFIIEIHKDNQTIPIGSSFLKNIDTRSFKAEFGIFIGETVEKGKGYGRIATMKTVEYAFQQLKLHKVYLFVFTWNDAAIRAYHKVGFKEEGILIEDYFDGKQYQNVLRMAIFNRDL